MFVKLLLCLIIAFEVESTSQACSNAACLECQNNECIECKQQTVLINGQCMYCQTSGCTNCAISITG